DHSRPSRQILTRSYCATKPFCGMGIERVCEPSGSHNLGHGKRGCRVMHPHFPNEILSLRHCNGTVVLEISITDLASPLDTLPSQRFVGDFVFREKGVPVSRCPPPELCRFLFDFR